MSPQNGENDNGEENGEPDISEMAKRWRQSTPAEPREDLDSVAYQQNGAIYLPLSIREKFEDPEWEFPVRFPAEYDEDENILVVQLDPVKNSENNDVATDGGHPSSEGTPTMQDVADLKEEVAGLKTHAKDLEARIEEWEVSEGLVDNGGDEYDDVQPKFVGEASAFDHADPDTLRTLADAIEEIREGQR